MRVAVYRGGMETPLQPCYVFTGIDNPAAADQLVKAISEVAATQLEFNRRAGKASATQGAMRSFAVRRRLEGEFGRAGFEFDMLRSSFKRARYDAFDAVRLDHSFEQECA